MIYGNVEFHNVHELLSGPGLDLLPPAAIAWLEERDPAALAIWRNRDEGPGLWFTRIPDGVRRKLNGLAQLNALQVPAAELRAVLEPGAVLDVTLASPFGPAIAEVYQGDAFVGWHVLGKEPTVVALRRPDDLEGLRRCRDLLGGRFDPEVTRLLLPWRPALRLLDVRGTAQPPGRERVRGLRWLAYGSSITHGLQCIHASGSYAARAAHRLGADLLNLGFGGGAHLEPAMADYIAGRGDWDFATLEMGINLRGLEASEFARRAARFVETIAAAHPAKPVFCIDLFTNDEDVAGGVTKTTAFRRVVRQLVRVSGRANLVYLSGRRLLDVPGGLTTDLVHPSPQGMDDIGERLARAVSRHFAALGLERSAGSGVRLGPLESGAGGEARPKQYSHTS